MTNWPDWSSIGQSVNQHRFFIDRSITNQAFKDLKFQLSYHLCPLISHHYCSLKTVSPQSWQSSM